MASAWIAWSVYRESDFCFPELFIWKVYRFLKRKVWATKDNLEVIWSSLNGQEGVADFAFQVHSSSSVHYNPLWSPSAAVHRICLSSCLLLVTSCWLQSGARVNACDSSSAARPLLASSFSGCTASVVLSVCCCDSLISTDSDSSLPSSLLPVSVSALWAPLSRHGCLRMVRRCLLRRDWLQCRVRLRCHWFRECWASTLSWRAAIRGRKLLM